MPGEGVLPNPLKSFTMRLVFCNNSITKAIRTVVNVQIAVNGIATAHSLSSSAPPCRKSRCSQTGVDYSHLKFDRSFSK